jgi:hypothetical protein
VIFFLFDFEYQTLNDSTLMIADENFSIIRVPSTGDVSCFYQECAVSFSDIRKLVYHTQAVHGVENVGWKVESPSPENENTRSATPTTPTFDNAMVVDSVGATIDPSAGPQCNIRSRARIHPYQVLSPTTTPSPTNSEH